MDVAALIAKAETVQAPRLRTTTSQWAHLFPVYSTLREKGLTCKEAMAWLVKEGAVQEDATQKALNAFWQFSYRINRKTTA